MDTTTKFWRVLCAFWRAKTGNIAMIFALSMVPLALAAGAGLDFAHAMMVRENISDALDAAALAVGGQPNLTASAAQALAQQVFNANYTADQSINPATHQAQDPQVAAPVMTNGTVTLTLQSPFQVQTTLLSIVGTPTLPVQVSTTVKWGQTKLWVALVLDNTGSMTETDSTGTSKITALKNASNQLLTMLQNAATNQGDVQVSITPFAKLVNIGTGYVNSNWIDWTDWNSTPRNASGASDDLGASGPYGPGDKCPWSANGSDGFGCVTQPGSTSTTKIVPSSGSYKGYICPGVMLIYSASSGLGGHYFEGCYIATKGTGTATATSGSGASCSGFVNSCTCSGSGSNKVCSAQKWNYAWKANPHSMWGGCIEDRNRKGDNGAISDFDTNNNSPSSAYGSLFPAANDENCPIASLLPLPSTWTAGQWTTLTNEVKAMVANGSTNQTIGLAHGWQTLTNTSPYNAPSLPANTSQYIILVSDGLNTQDRWYGDGTNQSTQVDGRMSQTCTNAKAAGIVIYTIFVDLGGTQGNSTVLQNCATDASKYYDLTTSNAIVTTFNQIGEQITNLRVSN